MTTDIAKRFFRLLCLLALATAGGCSEQNGSERTVQADPPTLTKLSPEQELLKEKAVAAQKLLFQSLLGELTKSLEQNGPTQSISVCRNRATEIAREVSEETGVRIGRTSFKLRNEANTAPAWASSFVKARVEQEVVVELPNERLGVLSPIRLQANCTLCHGSDAQIPPDVRAAIAMNYPRDRATGFAEGEIRGYFWMEAGD